MLKKNKHICKLCNKIYSSYQSLWAHNKKFHKQNIITPQTLNGKEIKIIICELCNKQFNTRQAKCMHKKKCKKNKINELENSKQQIYQHIEQNSKQQIYQQIEQNIEKNKQKIQIIKDDIKNIETISFDKQLINIIVEKDKKIQELNIILKNELKNESKNLILENTTTEPHSIILNNIEINSRDEDNYINASQLCQVGNIKLNEWFYLSSTKKLINILQSKTTLINIKKKCDIYSWIHPDLAIQLAQSISPEVGIQISYWIGNLSALKYNEINEKLKEKNKRIKLLENIYLTKHKRINYPEKNVIYILTSEDNKKKHIYIIGKSINLKNRLGNYNKSSEHEVIYYKSCKNKNEMNLVEAMVLNKLKDYKEKSNRDRFILPLEKDISFFTNIIDKCVDFF